MQEGKIEVERKFLLEEFPEVKMRSVREFEQSYLSFNPEVRIRMINKDVCLLTVKGEGTISRSEYETQITKKTYDELMKKIVGRTLKKTRYETELDGGYIAQIDEYIDFKELKFVVEVEFDSEEAADLFIPPEWFGREVTDDSRFKNKNLAWIKGE